MAQIDTTLNSAQAAKANAATFITYRLDLNQRQAAMEKIRAAHAAYLLDQYASAGVSTEAHERLYEKAWNEAHHGGYHSHDEDNNTTYFSATEFEYTNSVG